MAEEIITETNRETATDHAYGGAQIQVLEGLEAVRKRPGMYIGHHQRQKWADAHRTEPGSTLHHCIPLPAVQFRIELFVRGHRLIAVYRTLIQDAALPVEYLS